jgi:hypothetical protein
MGNISAYLKSCAKNVPGNKATVYINQIRRADSLTVTDGEVSALTVTATGATGKFVKVQADLDGVKFTNEGSGKSSYRETQSLEMIFAKKSADLVALKDDLSDSVPCGVMVIRVDGNGQAWLSGWNEASKDGKIRPYNELTSNFDSGQSPADEDGNKLTLTLVRNAGYDELPFDTALNNSIINESSTAGDFIGY